MPARSFPHARCIREVYGKHKGNTGAGLCFAGINGFGGGFGRGTLG